MRKQWIAKAAMLCVTVGMSVALPQYVMGAETATQVSQEEVVSSEKEFYWCLAGWKILLLLYKWGRK